MAKSLSQITRLPLVHLDSLYWTDGWIPRERNEFVFLVQKELEKESWILDGNMRRNLPQRLLYCDTVIFLDFPALVCFCGVLRRHLKYLGSSRPDMGGKCIEKFSLRSLRFLFSTLFFNRKNRNYFYGTIRKLPHIHLIILKSRKEVSSFLDNLQETGALYDQD